MAFRLHGSELLTTLQKKLKIYNFERVFISDWIDGRYDYTGILKDSLKRISPEFTHECYFSVYLRNKPNKTEVLILISNYWVGNNRIDTSEKLKILQKYITDSISEYYDNVYSLTLVLAERSQNKVNGRLCPNTVWVAGHRLHHAYSVLPGSLSIFTDVMKLVFEEHLSAILRDIWSTQVIYPAVATYIVAMFIFAMFFNYNDSLALSVRGFFYEQNYKEIFTCMFAHAGWSHLLSNLIALLIFGIKYEESAGALSFLSVFFIGGGFADFIAVLTKYETDNPVAMIGCSGAVYAILGALTFSSSYDRVGKKFHIINFLFSMAAALTMIITSAMTTEDIDNVAHLAGYFAGMAISYVTTIIGYSVRLRIYTQADYALKKREEYFYYRNRTRTVRAVDRYLESERTNELNGYSKAQWYRF